MEALVEQVRTVAEGQIDYEGQRLVEFLANTLLTVTGILAFLIGYTTGDISKTLWSGLIGALVTFLIVIPPWPMYNKHPVRWLPARTGRATYDVTVDGIKVQ